MLVAGAPLIVSRKILRLAGFVIRTHETMLYWTTKSAASPPTIVKGPTVIWWWTCWMVLGAVVWLLREDIVFSGG